MALRNDIWYPCVTLGHTQWELPMKVVQGFGRYIGYHLLCNKLPQNLATENLVIISVSEVRNL